MFNISNAVTIFTLLCILMTFIGRFKAKGAVAGSIWVKHRNIKICVLAPTPEASGFNIKTSIVSGVSRRKRKPQTAFFPFLFVMLPPRLKTGKSDLGTRLGSPLLLSFPHYSDKKLEGIRVSSWTAVYSYAAPVLSKKDYVAIYSYLLRGVRHKPSLG